MATTTANYDERVVNEFLERAWRWKDLSTINRTALNYISGFMLSGFTGNISLELNEGQYAKIIHTPASIKNREDLTAALLDMIDKTKR